MLAQILVQMLIGTNVNWYKFTQSAAKIPTI